MRRDFVDALPEKIEVAAGTLAKAGIEQINRLLALEKEFELLEEQERKKQRLLQEKPVLDAFGSWIETNKDKVLPKSKLHKAHELRPKLEKWLGSVFRGRQLEPVE